ncbi:MAG: antibiotic acetyltransferase [Lentisphaerae bacterium]|nr:antibiotic acetyltransferase [Lentisphaerota bacterium]
MWSNTFRVLMRDYYGIEIGRYSYGPLLDPGQLPEGTRVGHYCSLAAGVSVFRRNHPTNRFSQHPFFFNSAAGVLQDDAIQANRDHPLGVGDDVWIGANAIITPRCRSIGIGAVVAAGAVVTKDVPPFAIVGGVPARQIGERFSVEIQRALVESRWWEYPLERLIPVLPLFLQDAGLVNAEHLREHLQSLPPLAQSVSPAHLLRETGTSPGKQ